MKLTIESIIPSSCYDGRPLNYTLRVTTASGQRLTCLDPSGSAAFLCAGDTVNGLLTAPCYSFVPHPCGKTCLTGTFRHLIPSDIPFFYPRLVKHDLIGLETIDGVLLLASLPGSRLSLSYYEGRTVTILLTRAVYFEQILSDQLTG